MKRVPQGPMRTCVSCRQRSPRSKLVRIVLGDGGQLQVAVDHVGRGAWVCATQDCVTRLESNPKLAARSLRARPKGADDLLAHVREIADAVLAERLRAAHQSGLVRSTFRRRALIPHARVAAILRPASATLADTGTTPPEFTTPWSARMLGMFLNSGPRSHVLLLRGRPTRLVIEQLQRRARLG